MGDRCSLEMTMRKTDFDRLGLEAYFETNEVRDDGIVECYADEANYAYQSEREEWAAKGVLFVGNHGSGGDYCCGQFVSDGKQCFDQECPDGYMVRCDDNGDPEPESIANLKAFLKVEREVMAALGLKGGA